MKKLSKLKATTQNFIEIEEIENDVAYLANGNACMVLEVMSTNFALLSREEQDTRIVSYASLLNSLPFPIQICIRTEKLNISSYIRLLGEEEKKTQNQVLQQRIKMYKDFVSELVKVNTVLEKAFYIVIPYSYLEKGVGGASTRIKGHSQKEALHSNATGALHLKAKSLLDQLTRLNLRAKTLGKDELTRLFYEIYNGASFETTQITEGYDKPMMTNVSAKG